MANKAHTAYQLLNVGASLGGVDVSHTPAFADYRHPKKYLLFFIYLNHF